MDIISGRVSMIGAARSKYKVFMNCVPLVDKGSEKIYNEN